MKQIKEAHNSFLALGWIFSNQYLAWKACFDFHHTTPHFQPMTKFYVLVGFQATAVIIATVTQSIRFEQHRLSRNLVRHLATKLSRVKLLNLDKM